MLIGVLTSLALRHTGGSVRVYVRSDYYNRRDNRYDIDWFWTIVVWIFWSVVAFAVYLVVAGIVYKTRPSKTTWYDTASYLRAAGLDVDKTYHLRLGSASGGGSVGSFKSTATNEFFLFAGGSTLTTTGQILPSSTLRLSFNAPGTSYILEIPYSQVQFHKDPGAKASVKFIINDYWDGKFVQHNVKANYWLLQRGHPAAITPTPYQSTGWGHVVDIGLPTYLGRHLSRVILTITPQQYNAYLGTLQTAKG